MEEKTITHQQFIEGYKSGRFRILIDKKRVGDFVKTGRKKPISLFWLRISLLVGITSPIILPLFTKSYYGLIGMIIGFTGFMLANHSRESAGDFVLKNMLTDESFFRHILANNGAVIADNEGNIGEIGDTEGGSRRKNIGVNIMIVGALLAIFGIFIAFFSKSQGWYTLFILLGMLLNFSGGFLAYSKMKWYWLLIFWLILLLSLMLVFFHERAIHMKAVFW